jgi:hypothetical protein
MPKSRLDAFLPDAPFARWPMQAGGRTVYGLAWFTRPAAFVTQSLITHGTVAAAAMTEAAIDRVLTMFPREVTAARGLLVIHDWRRVTSFDPRVIQFYVDRLTVRNKSALRAIVIGMKVNPLARLAMQAVSGTISRVHGLEVEVSADLESTLVKYNVQRPDETVILE